MWRVLGSDRMVSTDVKVDNVLVNFAPSFQCESGQRFTDIQLADLESTVHITSRHCRGCEEIGTPIWRSPEAQLGLQWGNPFSWQVDEKFHRRTTSLF